jgi:hypothetical protein
MVSVPNKVLESLHNSHADRCVDVFTRDDGTFGFEEYRRDHEEGGVWFPLLRYSHQIFRTQDEALAQAKATVQWLLELE